MYEQLMAQKNEILKVQVGSHLYGLATSSSDLDFLSVFIPDEMYVLGMSRCEQVECRTNPSDSGWRNTKEDVDTVAYSLPKFMELCAGNNPNFVELLFAPSKNVLFCNEFGQRLLDAAPLFVSKDVGPRFLGYAKSQKGKLETRNYEGSRVELVQKYGYDTKFAHHLLRLLVEGLELLRDGRVVFPLREAPMLLDVKQGKYSKEWVLERATQLEGEVDVALAACTLPDKADKEKLSQLQMQLFKDFWLFNATRK